MRWETAEARVKEMEERYHAVGKEAEEKIGTIAKRSEMVEEKLVKAVANANQERIQAEAKAREEGVAEFKTSKEGKDWREETVGDFKNSEEGKEWCETLLLDPLTEALKDIIAFVQPRAPLLNWEGCPHYINLYSDEDTIDSRDDLSPEGEILEETPMDVAEVSA